MRFDSSDNWVFQLATKLKEKKNWKPFQNVYKMCNAIDTNTYTKFIYQNDMVYDYVIG